MKHLMTLILLISFASFASAQHAKKSKNTVPVSIIVAADQTSASQIDLPVYTSQILAELNKSQNVEFVLADPDSKSAVTIDIKIANLKVGPRVQRSANTTVPTERVRSANASGKLINVAPTLVREELIVERSSSANFTVSLSINENELTSSGKDFNSAYHYSQKVVAVPGYRNSKTALVPKQLPEPKTEEFLLLLSKKDLTGYLAGELRKSFDSKSHTAQIR